MIRSAQTAQFFFRLFGGGALAHTTERAMRAMHLSLGEEEALRPHFDRARIGVELV